MKYILFLILTIALSSCSSQNNEIETHNENYRTININGYPRTTSNQVKVFEDGEVNCYMFAAGISCVRR